MGKEFWQYTIDHDNREITIYRPFADKHDNLVFRFPLCKTSIDLCARVIIFLNWRC